MGFFSSKRQELAIPDPPPVLAVPVAQPVEEHDAFGGALTDYEVVAKAIQFQNPAVVIGSLRDFLRKNQILFYPYADVAKFLTIVAERVGKNWGWRPLRVSDARLIEKHCQRSAWSDHSGTIWNENGYFSSAQYLQAVPLPALAKVQTIIQGFPHQDQLAFSVSSYEIPKPDPFLCVVCPPASTVFVIDHWDEPGFRAST